MDDRNDNQAHFTHVFSTPLTAMRGAIDLLRNPKRTANDPISRELIETLERSCTQLRQSIDVLLAHSQIQGDIVEIAIPLDILLGQRESPTTSPEQHAPQALPPTEPSADMATTSFSAPIAAMQEALDLLRPPHRVADDTVTRALLDILVG